MVGADSVPKKLGSGLPDTIEYSASGCRVAATFPIFEGYKTLSVAFSSSNSTPSYVYLYNGSTTVNTYQVSSGSSTKTIDLASTTITAIGFDKWTSSESVSYFNATLSK